MTDRPLALVTGASSGIDFELARQFAQHGYDLVVAAEDGGIHDVPGKLTGTSVVFIKSDPRVLFTSLAASMMPGSYQSVYNASKSFVQSFSEALRDELRDTGITVMALMPGPTDTNSFHRAKLDETPVERMSKDDPAQVARQGFEALMRGDQKVVGGSVSSKVMGTVSRVLPDNVKALASSLLSKPRNK